MSKKIFIPVLLLLVMSAGFFFFWHQQWTIEKDIIYLKSGTLIAADDTWTKDQTVYYRKDWRIGTLSETDVEYIGKGDARHKKRGSDIVKSMVTALKSGTPPLFKSDNRKTEADPGALLSSDRLIISASLESQHRAPLPSGRRLGISQWTTTRSIVSCHCLRC